MLATGIVGTVYFAAILIVCGYKMDQFENSNMKNFVLGVFFSVMLLFISEVVFYRNFFWLLFVVMANLDYISRGGINNYDKR
jgi:O-antigen ligase